jgi:serine protease Do
MNTQSVIYRIERKLAAGWFLPIAGFLLFLILLVYVELFYPARVAALYGSQSNSALVAGLMAERDRIIAMVDGPCDSPTIGAYRRNEIGPLTGGEAVPDSPTNLPTPRTVRPDLVPVPPRSADAPNGSSTQKLEPAKLVSLMESSTVRVFNKLNSGFITGSGFFISSDMLLSNAHVVTDKPSGGIFIASKTLGDQPIPVKVVAILKNPRNESTVVGNDYAVLRLDSPALTAVSLALGLEPPPLTNVVAAGFPGKFIETDANQLIPSMIFSRGEVSVVQRQNEGPTLIIHTANIGHGSSGGPLVNPCGQVVGINTAVMGEDGEGNGRILYSLGTSGIKQFLETNRIPFTTETQCNLN